MFLLLETIIQVTRNHLLYSYSILTSQRIIFTISSIIHIMCTDITSDLCILVQTFQFISLWITVIFKCNWIVGKTEWKILYPLLLAVRFRPSLWLLTVKSSRSFNFCWYCSTNYHLLFYLSRIYILFLYSSDCLLIFYSSLLCFSYEAKSFWKRQRAE